MPVRSSTGRVWLNNNLGAEYADLNSPNFNPKQQATSSTDYKAYGSQFQWGRKADGHELISWRSSTAGTPKYGTTYTKSDNPSNPLFIIAKNWGVSFDWRVTQDDTLWASESSLNNVCPVGYRLPLDPNGAEDSLNEFNVELNSWSSKDPAGSLSSKLKLPLTGFRNSGNGWTDAAGFVDLGDFGNYWNGSVNGGNARNMYFGLRMKLNDNSERASGVSVRCIKD